MHPGHRQRPDEWERISAWPAHRARSWARGALHVASPSGQTQPTDLAESPDAFLGRPLLRPLSVFQGTVPLLIAIRGLLPQWFCLTFLGDHGSLMTGHQRSDGEPVMNRVMNRGRRYPSAASATEEA